MRFETAPGQQLQIGFGERLVEIGGRQVKAFVSAPPPSAPPPAAPTCNTNHEPDGGAVLADAKGAVPDGV